LLHVAAEQCRESLCPSDEDIMKNFSPAAADTPARASSRE